MSEYPGDEDCGWVLVLLIAALAAVLIIMLFTNIPSVEKTQESRQESTNTEINILENDNRGYKIWNQNYLQKCKIFILI